MPTRNSEDHVQFDRFSGDVDYPELEKRILRFWQDHHIFTKLRAKNAGKQRWSFIDGPITANNPMGVHHGWGRTYKDIFCRYKAMRGYDQRWQNGFDCQGLWLEVEVEKQLGFNSKQDIVDFGLENFSRACRARVEEFAERITQQSIRLGQWIQWHDAQGKPSSYFTLDDSNIEHIWHFLKTCEERGWLYVGHRVMPWCWRCGTSLSHHELIDSYREQTDPSVYFRCRIRGRPHENFLVWTTTPWTLPANTALAIHPQMDYARVRLDSEILYLNANRVNAVLPKTAQKLNTVKGRELIGLSYDGPFDELPAQARVARRTIAWEDISGIEGTGIVHVAPGCGVEDFELGKRQELQVLVPIDDNGYFIDGYGSLTGKHVTRSAALIREELQQKKSLLAWGEQAHRYPICWRCKIPLVFRLVDEWFISCAEVREPMKRAAEKVHWTPAYGGMLMQNWLDNMGDWCISRRRFWGLPLPFYVCQACQHRTVIGTKAELRQRALRLEAVDALPELHRPWIDEIEIICPQCHGTVSRVPQVGDCWLDAGIVPYSTLNYLRDHLGIADSLRSHRLENNRAATESTWQRWFPANFVTEMREQVRLWFYAMLFMSVTLENRTPYLSVLTYEEMRDENGNPFSKSGGNAIPFDDAAEKMGADPMRWLYAAAPLTQVFRFGYGPAHEVKRKLLTLWNCYKFFIEYANIDKPVLRLGIFRRQLMNDLPRAELDRWILARLQQLIASCNDRFEQYDAAAVTREIERFIDDLSTWYVRQSRRRFWKSENDADKAAAYQTLYDVLVSIAVLIAPIVPFMAEELFQKLVRSVDRNAPESVHLCGYPHGHPAWVNEQLVGDIATVRRVVSLGLAARNAANLKVRQPLMRALVKPADAHQRDVLLRLQPQILNELNVKQVEFTEDESKLTSIVVNPNLAKVGPKFGKRLLAIRNALAVANPAMIAARVAANETFELDLGDGSVTLVPEDVIIGHTPVSDFAVSSDGGCTVALDTRLTRELVQEGVARDFVRHVQELRKTATLNLTDRITVYYAANGEVREAITNQASYIRRETLAEQLHANKPPSGTMTATVTLREKSVEIGIVRLLKGCTQPGEDDAKQFDH